MAWGIAAGALIGGIAGLAGGEATNANNAAINAQNEAWQTQMSNTAVQRRAADMQAAGINPILAAGNPASQPNYNPIAMQNPFGNASQSAATGAQIGTAYKAAEQTDANIENTNADTRQKEYMTDTQLPETTKAIKANYALTDAQAVNTKALLDGITADSFAKKNYAWQTAATNLGNVQLQNEILASDRAVKLATREALISSANSDATAKEYGLSALKNQSDFSNSAVGQWVYKINEMLRPVGTALGAAGAMRGMMPRNTEQMQTGPDGQTYTTTRSY